MAFEKRVRGNAMHVRSEAAHWRDEFVKSGDHNHCTIAEAIARYIDAVAWAHDKPGFEVEFIVSHTCEPRNETRIEHFVYELVDVAEPEGEAADPQPAGG